MVHSPLPVARAVADSDPCTPRAQLTLATPLLKAGAGIDVADHAVKGATARDLFEANGFADAFEKPLTLAEWVMMLRGE